MVSDLVIDAHHIHLPPSRALRITLAFATLVVNAGRAITTNLVSGVGGTLPRYLGWGTGSGTALVTDTTLFTEDSGGSPAYARVLTTNTRITTTVANDTIQFAGVLTANASKTITNVGVFDAVSAGNLFVKGDFTGQLLASGDSMHITLRTPFA